MNVNKIKKRNSDTIAWILGFNMISKKKLEDYINEHGVRYLLQNYRTLDFSLDEIEKIDKDIVSEFVKSKKLYEDTYKNCVFVGYDEEDNLKFASVRGTNTKK